MDNNDVEQLSQRLAAIDGRPNHTEDYEGDIKRLLKYVHPSLMSYRLAYLKESHSSHSSYSDMLHYLLNGLSQGKVSQHKRDDLPGQTTFDFQE